MSPVTLEDPTRMNLLGHFLADLLERNLAEPRRARLMRGFRADLLLDASGMKVTLRFDGARVTVVRGVAGNPRAMVQGSLAALMALVTRRSVVSPLLSRRVRVRGRLPVVLRALPALVD